jgi:hypothetical protein
VTTEAPSPPTPVTQEPRTAPPRHPNDANPAPDDAVEPLSPENTPLEIECPDCGCAFTTTEAHDRHRPNGKCIKPTDAGLVVAPRVRLTWSKPVKVPTEVDPFGNVVAWVAVDREIAGHWDERVWRDHP